MKRRLQMAKFLKGYIFRSIVDIDDAFQSNPWFELTRLNQTLSLALL